MCFAFRKSMMHQHRLDLIAAPQGGVRQWIEDHRLRLNFRSACGSSSDASPVVASAGKHGTKELLTHGKRYSDRPHVAEDLAWILQRRSTSNAARWQAAAANEAARLLCPSQPCRDQDARTTIVAAPSIASSRCTPDDTRRGNIVGQADRSDRQHGDAVLVDQERVFVGAVRGAAILDDPQSPRGNILRDAMVQEDHAVGDVFFQAMARQRTGSPLPRDDRGDPFVFEPAEQPPQFGPDNPRIGESAKEGFQGVEHDPLGADRIDGQPEPDEQAFQVVFASLPRSRFARHERGRDKGGSSEPNRPD